MNEKIIELSSKPVESLSDDERQLIVSRIEGTCEIVVAQPADEKVVGFVKGYWEGDAKTVKEVEFSNKKELTGMPTTGEAATVEVTHLKSPSTHNILKKIYAVNGADIAVIILIGQEKIHLKRCVEKLAALKPRQIFLVESQPDDGGVAIAKETAAKLGLRLESKFNKWPGNQATQFNWALDELVPSFRCQVSGSKFQVSGFKFQVSGSKFQVSGGEVGWILRLDADEYLDEKGIEWLKANLTGVPEDVDALEFTLERKFMGGVIRHATNGIKMVRMFRAGRAKYAETLMDERLIYEGKKLEVPVVFWDDNLNGLEWWKNKHRGYAKREAEQALTLFDCSDCSNARMKNGAPLDPRKVAYYKLPRYLRAVMYFCIRYFLKGGFLDGRAGWKWNFWQGLWYRWIVDREISRSRKS